MRKLFVIVAIILVSASCQNRENKGEESSPAELVNTVKYEIQIEGMTCTGCEETIKAGINKLDGIKSVEADHLGGKAVVEFAESKTDTTAIKESITGTGYKVVTVKPFADSEIKEE